MKKLAVFITGDRKGLENNIRVCLSSNKCFVKVNRSHQAFSLTQSLGFILFKWSALTPMFPGSNRPWIPKRQEELLESGWGQHHPEDAAQTFQWYDRPLPWTAEDTGQKSCACTYPLSTSLSPQDRVPSDQIHRPFFYRVPVTAGSAAAAAASGAAQCAASSSDGPQHQLRLLRPVLRPVRSHRLADIFGPHEHTTQHVLHVQISAGGQLEETCAEHGWILSRAAACSAVFTTLSLSSHSSH